LLTVIAHSPTAFFTVLTIVPAALDWATQLEVQSVVHAVKTGTSGCTAVSNSTEGEGSPHPFWLMAEMAK